MFGRKRLTAQERSADPEVRNAMDSLYANLGFLDMEGAVRSIVVTSAFPGEGKTTVSVELCRTMALSGKRTLVVECDMRRRSVAGVLGVHAPAGLCSVVLGDVALGQALLTTGVPNLSFLDAEPGIASPSDILDSERFRALLRRLERAYDYVVLDTPPVGVFVDAAVLSSMASATVLVVREGATSRDGAKAACDQLRKAGGNVVGIVVNCCGEAR